MLNDRLTTLQDLLRHPRLEQAADLALKAGALFALLYLISGYFVFPTLAIFGNDEVHYFSDFHFKLKEDARWLNYLLHDFLRSVPLEVWSMIYVVLFWLVSYRLARVFALDVAHSALAASALVLSSPILEMSLWPASVVPALVITGIAMLMHARGVAYPVIYLVAGILLFGAMQTIYFVLPMLFFQQFADASQPASARFQLLFKHMLWWVAGSVAGVLVMILMLKLLADMWFPVPAEWRKVNPVVDIASLMTNIRFAVDAFLLFLRRQLVLGGVSWPLIYFCFGVALLRARSVPVQWPVLLMLFAVMISFFVFSVPLAALIQQRSLIALAAVIIVGVAILPGRTAAGRILSAVLLLKFAYHYSIQAQMYLEIQRYETAVYMEQLWDLFPGYPKAFKGLALYGTMDPARPEARRFNDPSQMHPMIVSLGVEDFRDCRIAGRCDAVGPGTPIASMPFAGGQLELSVDANNIGIIRYVE